MLPLSEVFERLCISETKLARALGVTTQTVYRWRREGEIPAKHIPKIVDVFKLPVDWEAYSTRVEVRKKKVPPTRAEQTPDGGWKWYD
jgi:transposase-like protein